MCESIDSRCPFQGEEKSRGPPVTCIVPVFYAPIKDSVGSQRSSSPHSLRPVVFTLFLVSLHHNVRTRSTSYTPQVIHHCLRASLLSHSCPLACVAAQIYIVPFKKSLLKRGKAEPRCFPQHIKFITGSHIKKAYHSNYAENKCWFQWSFLLEMYAPSISYGTPNIELFSAPVQLKAQSRLARLKNEILKRDLLSLLECILLLVLRKDKIFSKATYRKIVRISRRYLEGPDFYVVT